MPNTQHAVLAPIAQVDSEPVPFSPFDPQASTLVVDGYTVKLSVVDGQFESRGFQQRADSFDHTLHAERAKCPECSF